MNGFGQHLWEDDPVLFIDRQTVQQRQLLLLLLLLLLASCCCCLWIPFRFGAILNFSAKGPPHESSHTHCQSSSSVSSSDSPPNVQATLDRSSSRSIHRSMRSSCVCHCVSQKRLSSMARRFFGFSTETVKRLLFLFFFTRFLGDLSTEKSPFGTACSSVLCSTCLDSEDL